MTHKLRRSLQCRHVGSICFGDVAPLLTGRLTAPNGQAANQAFAALNVVVKHVQAQSYPSNKRAFFPRDKKYPDEDLGGGVLSRSTSSRLLKGGSC